MLLRLSRVQSEQDLAHIWHRIASSNKSEWSATVQAAYDKAKIGLCEHHLTMTTDVATVTTMVCPTCYMTTKDAIDTCINPFRFSDADLEAAQQRHGKQT